MTAKKQPAKAEPAPVVVPEAPQPVTVVSTVDQLVEQAKATEQPKKKGA